MSFTKLTKSCDECGLINHIPKGYGHSDNPTVHKWYRIGLLKLTYRHKDSGDIPDKNTIRIDEEKDPDFCSKKCIMKWFDKQVDKVKKG